MLNLVPQHEPEAWARECPEPVMRLASVRQALRLVSGGFSTGPEDDLDEAVGDRWHEAGEARQRWFERRSGRLVGSAAAGIEALLGQRNAGREAHRAANETLVKEIRRELRDVAGIILGPSTIQQR
jgi:hypothetical protein